MKKSLIILSGLFMMSVSLISQTNTATPETPPSTDTKKEEFDKKFRFGIRVAPQPTWLKSNNEVSKGSGANFGFGFGLILDFKLSQIIHFTTGLGGDFEGGFITYKFVTDLNNPANDISVNYVIDKENNIVEAKDGKLNSDYELVNGTTQYVLNARKYKATYVTIPIMLKMMTQEYSGLKYFFNFGGELGIRAGLKADDTYHSGVKTTINSGTISSVSVTELSRKNINVGNDASLIPLRFGMNLGFGTEYRLGGSTSFLTSINYFQAFTNLMRNDSKYITKGAENTYDSGGWNFAPLRQGYFMRAIRINIGLMF